MSRRETIVQAIYRAVDDINPALPPARRLAKSPESPLMEHLDSLGMVNLIIATEEHVAEAVGTTVNLANRQAVSQSESPLRTIETLAAYIEHLLEEGNTHG